MMSAALGVVVAGRGLARSAVPERLGLMWTIARSAGRRTSMVLDRSRLVTLRDFLTFFPPDALPSTRRVTRARRLRYLLLPQW